MLGLLNKYKKPLMYIIGGILLLYLLIVVFTTKPQMPVDLKASIDSLNRVNQQLIKKQKSLDSIIQKYDEKVSEIDFKINNIKEKTTIVREYYYEKQKQIDKYTPTQIDSFFRNRYNY